MARVATTDASDAGGGPVAMKAQSNGALRPADADYATDADPVI
jgi:hypothetical protein